VEWNFQFRIDHLQVTGEERNLKGLVFTEDNQTPTVEQIMGFLKNCGYNVEVKDAEQMIFIDRNPKDPVEIKIVKLGNQEEPDVDFALRLLAEQFRKR
jgi:hypothetical protein